jgi:plasmid maintenance system antidote protein VapI
MTLRTHVMKYCDQHGQVNLAEQIGVSQPTISTYLQGKTSENTVLKLEKFFGVRKADLHGVYQKLVELGWELKGDPQRKVMDIAMDVLEVMYE